MLGCKTGKDLDNPSNIMNVFREQGADTVIGFNELIATSVGVEWSERFWDNALEDGLNVHDAAFRAAEDIPWWFPGQKENGINEQTLVILGDAHLNITLDK